MKISAIIKKNNVGSYIWQEFIFYMGCKPKSSNNWLLESINFA